jgi:hypothetical protein
MTPKHVSPVKSPNGDGKINAGRFPWSMPTTLNEAPSAPELR